LTSTGTPTAPATAPTTIFKDSAGTTLAVGDWVSLALENREKITSIGIAKSLFSPFRNQLVVVISYPDGTSRTLNQSLVPQDNNHIG